MLFLIFRPDRTLAVDRALKVYFSTEEMFFTTFRYGYAGKAAELDTVISPFLFALILSFFLKYNYDVCFFGMSVCFV